ncbi:MAG: imidazole glycerol phosphate synthase subunit HisF [Betaproteobacteria bacterium]|nr:imidazole glycerol phosphate synthase subunit HisF [Betaproteobacteria bacterium]
MLKKRIIPCLDIRDGRVTKGVEFKNNIDVGCPVHLSEFYSQNGADEIVIYDITASVEKRAPDFAVIEKIAAKSFVPICIGGGIRDFSDASHCIGSGAEKVSLNSIAPRKPELITEISSHFGVQAVVLSLDVQSDASCPSGYRLFINGGRLATEWDMLRWLEFALPLGVGELCINSIDQDGKRSGYDLNLLRLVKAQVRVPVIMSGGAGEAKHLVEAFVEGADAALVASIVHSGETSVQKLKEECTRAGIAVRLDW